MNVRRVGRWIALVAFLAFALGIEPAYAQSDDVAMAQSLFDSGRELMREGKHAEACEKFGESNRLDPSAGTLLNLGQCQEALGKTASAWASYEKAIVLARAKNQARHEEAAQEYVAAIVPKLSKLQVDAPTVVDGLVIRRDEVEMGAGVLGVPLAVDPGTYRVQASAPGYETWETTVDVGRDADLQKVTIPALAEADDAPAFPPPPLPPGGPDGGTTPPDSDAGEGQRIAGFILGGAGIAALAVGSVFGVMTLGEASDAESNDDLCPNKECSDAGLEQIDGAETKAWIANIGIGVGVAALAAGAILVFTAESGGPPASVGATAGARPRLWIAPAGGPTGAGGIVGGAF